jgi:hypothetical protein
MKIVKLHIPLLVAGALVAAGQASAAPTEADYARTQQESHAAADKWRDEIKQSFDTSRKHEAYLKAMQESSAKLRAFLLEKPCRDGEQAKAIEAYIHDRFHTLYGRVVADIKHGVDLNCRDHKLAVTFWITDFTPTAQMIADEKGVADMNNSNKSLHEVEEATKRIFGNWATAVAPIFTDKSKKIEDIRAGAIKASEQIKPQLAAVPCYDLSSATYGTKANLAAATKELSQNFTGYTIFMSCTAKKLDFYFNFTELKRKGT